ncbi:MAG TPA: hypothetical protein VFG54_12110 [Prolixibacteraceae bacterium]|nr:hypothetical protein [Prolixibacteraceae bacterium]
MGKIYSKQPFKIELSYDELPGVVVSARIKYKTPMGTTGEFNANIDRENKKIYYYSQDGETLKYAGTWTLWSVITLENGSTYPGEGVKVVVWKEGQ